MIEIRGMSFNRVSQNTQNNNTQKGLELDDVTWLAIMTTGQGLFKEIMMHKAYVPSPFLVILEVYC